MQSTTGLVCTERLHTVQTAAQGLTSGVAAAVLDLVISRASLNGVMCGRLCVPEPASPPGRERHHDPGGSGPARPGYREAGTGEGAATFEARSRMERCDNRWNLCVVQVFSAVNHLTLVLKRVRKDQTTQDTLVKNQVSPWELSKAGIASFRSSPPPLGQER
jgi:hypothetical protein